MCMQGVLSSADTVPDSMLAFTLCCVVEYIEATTSAQMTGATPNATACAVAAAVCPLLCRFMDRPQLAMVCSYGIGVCLVAATTTTQPPLSQNLTMECASAIFRQLAQLANSEEEDSLYVRDSLVSSLFKIALHRNHLLADNIRDECVRVACNALPLAHDVFEARLLHTQVVCALEAMFMGQLAVSNQLLLNQVLVNL
jgi:hypothetical protein